MLFAHNLKLFPILGDGGERVVRRRRLYRVVQFDVGQLAAADDALLRLRRQRVPSVQIVEIFLHDHIAATGECGILLTDERGVDHRLATRILSAVDEAQEVAVIEVTKAVDLVDRRDRVAEACHDLRRHLEAKVICFARIWNSRSPGVETAWCGPARISRNGWSSAGRGFPNSRSHASDPIPITQERPASRSRNSTARINPARSAQNDRTTARLSGPGFIVTTRKIAARVSGADTGCATTIASILPTRHADHTGGDDKRDGSALTLLWPHFDPPRGPPQRRLAEPARAFSQTDFTEDLKKISVPLLVMHGDDDQIVPYADSAPLSAKLLKNGTLKTYKGCIAEELSLEEGQEIRR